MTAEPPDSPEPPERPASPSGPSPDPPPDTGTGPRPESAPGPAAGPRPAPRPGRRSETGPGPRSSRSRPTTGRRPPAGPGRGGSSRPARASAASATRGPRHRRRRAGAGPVLLVLAVVAALTAGWPLLSAALGTTTPVEEGSGIRLEAPSGADARLTVHGTGWELRGPAGVPGAGRTLALGTVRLEARPVVPAGEAAGDPAALPAALWNGLARVVRIADPDTRLGEPSDTETLGGLPALTGPLEREGCTGTAWVVPAPDAVNAVQITATDCGSGDGDAPAELPPEVERTALSTGFPALRTEAAAPAPSAPAPAAEPRAPPTGVPAGALPTSPAPTSGAAAAGTAAATASAGTPPGPPPPPPTTTPPPPVSPRAIPGSAPGAGSPVRIGGPLPVDRPTSRGTTEAV